MTQKKRLALHWQIIIGLAAGVVFAIISANAGWSAFTLDWIAPWGRIFINLLKLIAVPMVLFSIIMGVVSLGDTSKLGRMGAKTLGMYLITTFFAVGVGLVLVNLLQPGTVMDEDQRVDNRIRYELWVESTPGVEILDGKDYLNDPNYKTNVNRVAAQSEAEAEALKDNKKLQAKMATRDQQKESGPLQFLEDMVPSNLFYALHKGNGKSEMLQIIFFAIFFGVVLIMIPKDKATPVIKVVDGLNEIFVKMVIVVMRAAPFFVFALLAGTVSDLAGDDPKAVLEIFKGLSWYSIVVVIGLMLMVVLVYPMLAKFLARIGYGHFFKSMGAAQTMAFSTSSSVATLPVTIDCVENKLGVPNETASFVLPIGATVNMDGTSLYQAVAVIFLAQIHLVDLSFGQQLTIVLTATLSSIGAAAVPSAGLIMMMVVLESVGLNPAWIAIIFPVDRILDMCRTVVNVTGDATVSAIIARSEGQLDLKK